MKDTILNKTAKLCLPGILGAVALIATQSAFADVTYKHVITFDDPVPVAESQAPDVWFVDRYRPAAFESSMLEDRNVLRIQILNSDGAQNRPPGGYSGGFYNTQGRKFDLPPETDKLSGELFYSASWEGENTRRRSDLWATAVDDGDVITAYPIIGIANNDGSPVIRYWDTDTWVNTSITPVPDTWYRFDILLEGEEFIFLVNGTEVGRSDANGTARMRDIIIQAYNYNDTNLSSEYSDNAEDYEVFWDNISFDFELNHSVQVLAAKNNRKLARSRSTKKYRATTRYTKKPTWRAGIANRGDRTDFFQAKMNRSNRKFKSKAYDFQNGRMRNVTGKLLTGRFVTELDPDKIDVLKIRTSLTGYGKRMARQKFRDIKANQSIQARSVSAPALKDKNGAKIRFKAPSRPATPITRPTPRGTLGR